MGKPRRRRWPLRSILDGVQRADDKDVCEAKADRRPRRLLKATRFDLERGLRRIALHSIHQNKGIEASTGGDKQLNGPDGGISNFCKNL